MSAEPLSAVWLYFVPTSIQVSCSFEEFFCTELLTAGLCLGTPRGRDLKHSTTIAAYHQLYQISGVTQGHSITCNKGLLRIGLTMIVS